MAVWEGKKYKLVKNDNYDEYLKELGVGLTLRKICNTEVPTIELQGKDSMYMLTKSSAFTTAKTKFRLNHEFDEVTFDNRRVKSNIQKQHNNFVYSQVGTNALPTTIVWQFSSTELIITLTVGKVKAVQLYRTVEANEENDKRSLNETGVKKEMQVKFEKENQASEMDEGPKKIASSKD